MKYPWMKSRFIQVGHVHPARSSGKDIEAATLMAMAFAVASKLVVRNQLINFSMHPINT